MAISFSKLFLSIAVAFTAPLALSAQAQAYSLFFGEDLNSSEFNPLAATPNANAAEADFLSNLVGVGTEDFEGFTTGAGTPLNLAFPGAGTATLTGGGAIDSVIPGTAINGRYGTSGSNFFEVTAGGANNFRIDFSEAIAAFGFFGIDIGDFGGQLELELGLVGGATETIIVPNTLGSNASTGGSVLFQGLIADNSDEEFISVSFLTSTGMGDVFGFDDFTIGSREQVQPNPEPTSVPEPASILGLLIIGALGLSTTAVKRKVA
ncbi:MAG: PEP-CTERM sorting domain-containing protein [Cyanobacteria bacterium J06639_14]